MAFLLAAERRRCSKLSSVLCVGLALAGGSLAAGQARIVLDGHPSWIRLRQKAIDLASAHVERREGWKPMMTCMPGVPCLWQWDSCFMAMFAGYAPDGVNGLGNLDNLYSLQAADGFIAMAYRLDTREPMYGNRVSSR